MRSLRGRLTALVITLIAVACASVAIIGIQHERHALESAIRGRGVTLTAQLAAAAKDSLLAFEQGDLGGELALERLVSEVGELDGVRGARLMDRDGEVIASATSSEGGVFGCWRPKAGDADSQDLVVTRCGSSLEFAALVLYSGVRVGEAQVEFDLTVLVDPVIRSSRNQLVAAAIAVMVICGSAGVVFVALLVKRKPTA